MRDFPKNEGIFGSLCFSTRSLLCSLLAMRKTLASVARLPIIADTPITLFPIPINTNPPIMVTRQMMKA
jgi:hypothetical protein